MRPCIASDQPNSQSDEQRSALQLHTEHLKGEAAHAIERLERVRADAQQDVVQRDERIRGLEERLRAAEALQVYPPPYLRLGPTPLAWR